MLETEIKKLTAALEANTAALNGALPAKPAGNTEAAVVVPNVPVPNVTPGAAVLTPAPAAVVPPPQPAVVPPAAVSPSEITKDQVLQELSAVNQKLGDNGVKLNALFEQMYPGHNLTTLGPAQYGTIIAAARGLVA